MPHCFGGAYPYDGERCNLRDVGETGAVEMGDEVGPFLRGRRILGYLRDVGETGAVEMGDEVGPFLRGRRILGWHPSYCVHPSVFILMNPSGTRHQEEICPLAACTG